MEQERRNMRMGILVILCALMLQLASDAFVQVFADPRVASFFVFVETGRWVRFEVPPPPETEPTTVATEPPRQAVSFDIQEAELVEISNFTHYEPDIGALLTSPLSWDLTEGGPAVLIVHTHATESYTGTPGYRTEDENHNMLRVGQEIKEILEENGIEVIHDTTLHDEPSYNNAYIYARETIEARLEEYPSIRVVLDIHRDALELSEAVQLSTSATVDGENSAQLMLVMGTDAGNRYHPDWQGNLAVGVKLQVLLERNYPGICRRMQLRTERFNQDLAPGGMLVEVGAAGDTLEEALVAARAFARCLVELSQGTAD
jgi:stage II sporulation protein P